MLNDYKISVIVPAYNIEKYLPRCLDSILNQTHKNLEVIVISDGSTDNTNSVIEEYAKKDNRIVPLFKENSGVSDTRNRGLEIATGDYIGFVDGDDYIEPDMYEALLSNALEYNADISHCGYQMVFPSRVDYYYNTSKKLVQNKEQGIIDMIKGEYIEPGIWNKLYKKEILKDVKMDADIKFNEDLLFNIFAFNNADLSVYEDKPLYHYILRKGSAMTSEINVKKITDPVLVLENIYKFSKNKSTEIQNIAFNKLISKYIRTYVNIKILKVKKLSVYAKELRKKVKAYPSFNGLTKRTKIEKFLLLYLPFLLVWIYKFYENILSKNKDKYEVK